MGIYRGIGGTGDSTTDANYAAVQAKAVEAAASAAAAATSASSASSSASSAQGNATSASTSASNAAASASTATTQASSATTSASSASTSATSAATSASSASTSATTATTKASEAVTSATNAASSATSAATSATNASSSASSATTSATNASTSASSASTSASTATTKASEATTAAASAAASLVSVQQIFDNFDDVYLGAKASDPTVDNDGNALVAGQLYWNTTVNDLKFYNGAAWESPEYTATQAATSATNSATSAATSATTATTQATNASNSASAASTSATNASSSASAANTSATNAAASASTATTQATNASTSASTATTQATSAATSATSAANSATSAATSAADAVTTLASSLKIANNLSDLNNAATARSNLGLVIGTNVLAPNGSAASLTSFPTLNQNTTGTASNVTGTVAVANGGTGATTAGTARTNLGATTVGSNLYTLANPSAVTFLRFNADNTVSALSASTFRTAIGAGTGSGSVTSVGGTGTVSGLTLTGTVTSSGSLTLGGTLSVTPSNFASQTANTVLAAPNGSAGVPAFRTLVSADIPTLNQNTTGTAGNVTGTVAIANGGTGATTAGDALTNLGAYAASNPAGYTTNTGTVTSVTGTSPVASSGGTTPAISLDSGYGDTLNPFASKTANYILAAPNGSAGVPTFRAIVAADIPTLNQSTTGTASNVTGTVAVTNGGTGATTASGARTNLGLVIGTDVLSPTGSAASLTSFPTFNQNTTGTASNVTGTIAVANGGTGATTASGARTNLGLVIGTDVLAPNGSAASLTSFPTFNQNTTGTASNVTGTVAIANGGTGATTLAGASIATYSGTETLTNKRIDPRDVSAASASSLTPDISVGDIYAYTALAADLTINAPNGSPTNGDKLIFRLLDNGTSRTLTWNATYTVIGVTLPTATTANKTTYVGCIYNANNTRWDVIAVTTQV